LGENLLDLLEPQPAGFKVKLNAGDAIARAGDLEVHLAEEVFLADDVGDVNDGAIVFGKATDGNACTRGLDGHTRIHERKAAAAD
jgi:hypothetical protein